WTVGAAGDSAVSGLWTRVEPYGTTIGAPVTGVDADHCGCGSNCSCLTFGQTAARLAAGACCGGRCGESGMAAVAKPNPGSMDVCAAHGSERAPLVARPGPQPEIAAPMRRVP